MVSKAKPIPAKYKLIGSGKERHVVVESGYSFKNGKKVPNYRIIGRVWGRG